MLLFANDKGIQHCKNVFELLKHHQPCLVCIYTKTGEEAGGCSWIIQ